ncbi:ABC transporter substrate-binding protein [Kitasatospora sp. NPDC057223]|uniref:ABC transporter substrate-binding protein n=1 Tax=Kitasatospora sp. NPDC057223 TaxID=3346055 RepID=UPI0036384D4D
MSQASPPAELRRRSILKGALTGAVVLSVGALLEACGAQPSGSTRSVDSGGQASAGQDTHKEIPLLRVSLPGSLSSLYPGQESGILNYYVANIAMEGLVGVDGEGRLVPALASAVTRTDDRTYVYTLREGALFHDGSPVTVEDVLYSITMAADSTVSPSTASYWADLASAEKTGANEITLVSKSGGVAFAWLPASADALWIAPKSFWQSTGGKVGTTSTLFTGTGPYQVTAFKPDSYIEFSRNPHWWGAAPKAAKLRIDFIPDDSTRRLAWQSGEADVSLNVPLAAAKQWEGVSGTRVVYTPDRSYAGLTFNTSVAPFDDPHVRRAVAHAIDRAAIVKEVLHGHGQVATALSTPEQFGGLWTPEQATAKLATVPQHEYSLDRARAELAQSKVPGGFTADLSYPSTGPHLGTAALAFAADLKKIGITLNVKELAVEQWIAELNTFPGLAFFWYFNTTGDPGELVSWLFGAENPAKYSGARAAELVGQAATTGDPAARAELLLQAQQAQAADAAYAPLWWGQSALALRDTVGISGYTSYTLVSPWPTQIYAAV